LPAIQPHAARRGLRVPSQWCHGYQLTRNGDEVHNGICRSSIPELSVPVVVNTALLATLLKTSELCETL